MMKKLLLCAAMLLAIPAVGQEIVLGSIVSAAGDTTNATTATPFFVQPSAFISIQCNAVAYVITDDLVAVTSTRGVKLAANQLFQTKVGTQARVTAVAKSSAVIRVVGDAAVTCKVWARKGNE